MKKIISIFSMCVLLHTQVYATLTDGSLVPDFTIVDVNGNSFNLYTALADGKTVIVEFIATWDENSWAYHNNGSLQELHNSHGPQGTCSDDVIVLMIESDLSTDISDLNGSGNNTQGNWLENSPFNVYNLTSETVINDYLITEFPTIYRICPSKVVRTNGMLSAMGHVASITDCGLTNDIALSDNTEFIQCTPEIRFVITNVNALSLENAVIYYSIDGGPEASYVWSGSLAAAGSVEVVPDGINPGSGLHQVTCRLELPDGTITDMNGTNNCHEFSFNVIDQSVTATPYVQNFGNDSFPYSGWSVDNPDQSVSWHWVNTPDSMMMLNCFTYPDTGATDRLVMEPLVLSGSNAEVLSFDLAYAPYNDSFYDGLSIIVSQDCGNSWNEIFFKQGAELATAYQTTDEFVPSAGQWRSECVSLSAFTGAEQLLIAFAGHNGWGNNIYIDNISVGENCVTPVIESGDAEVIFTCYPNPAGDLLTVEFPAHRYNEQTTLRLTDVTGKIVSSLFVQPTSAAVQRVEMATGSLPSGCYMLSVDFGTSILSTRVIVQ